VPTVRTHPGLDVDHSRTSLILRLLHGLGAVNLADDRGVDFLAPVLLQVTPIARVVIFEIAQVMTSLREE
jgi:hypothetical protein